MRDLGFSFRADREPETCSCFTQLIDQVVRDDSAKMDAELERPRQQRRHLKVATSYYSTIVKRIRYNKHFIAMHVPSRRTNLSTMLLVVASTLVLVHALAPISLLEAASSSASQAGGEEQVKNQHDHHHYHQDYQLQLKQEKPQARVGGLDPSDYIDEAGELDIMANQQQIPTAQLLAAAGHSIPENYFLPGGSIPALYALRYQQNLIQQQQQQQQHQQQQYQQQQQQQQQLQQQQQRQETDPMQQVASSHVQARHVAPGKFSIRQADLIAAASTIAEQQQDLPSLIDYNGFNLVSGASAPATESKEPPAAGAAGSQAAASTSAVQPGAIDLAEFLNPTSQQALYEQQQQQQQYAMEQQLVAELAALRNQQQEYGQAMDQQAQPSENSAQDQQYAPSLGPSYQVEGSYEPGQAHKGQQQQQQQQQRSRPFGLPTKSSNKEPSDMLKPLGNPKTISSPAIDFVTNQLPKTSQLDKLAEKVPQGPIPTVFSFASSKDPSEKVKVVNQKKRNVMRQAEQLAKMMIKSVNDKFGTNIGDQTDIPFLLSSLTPLGLAQNILFDPTLFVTLLNSIEKTYISDVLPGPAKAAIRPVLNLFRMPNKKRDKANLSNVISFLASGMQAPSQGQVKHRPGTGIEKAAPKSKNNR